MKKVASFLLNKIPRPMLINLSIFLRPLIYLFFKGNNFTDPIDGKSYRKFLPYGYGKQRENALSPGTLSLERHRQMWLYLQNETDFFTKNYKVLHIAPEQEFLRKFKKMKNLDYTSADLFSPIVDVKADILDLPFEDESFEWLNLEDQTAHISHCVILQDGHLIASLYIAPKALLPDRDWVASLFKRERLSAMHRKALLAGQAMSMGESEGPLVCSCFKVGKNRIIQTIKEKNISNEKQVTACLKAGGNCGSCLPEIRGLIKAYQTETT